ncbi:ATPase [Nocardiopsis sp. CNR-923]|uniref:BTAD domain-containing putative transcriptional regulator n=1 Tax=Nocardiopsis sp. CNR-923 TaxID=1904965 RepID=UPI0009697871|nr:BTAD domain-containing putative transcriptional regulator [Nocardiopsis sp. CNR-923]OLT26061.1 ATPase [Nocardiopsis sp. CNR-923]
MRFGVLGPLAVWTSQGRQVRVPEVKVRTLLAELLVDPGAVVSADRLVDDLWDGPLPANPAASLQTRVSQLRKALGDAEPGGRELVVSRPPGYLLAVGADAVDAGAFQDLLSRAHTVEDPEPRASLLSDALALWRGPAFADVADHAFARPAIARLEEQRLTVLEEQAEARLALGEHDLVADELGALVERHPARERLRAAHMRALYRSGRQSQALASFHDLRTHLTDELGLDPGPELVALHGAILRQDPGLSPAPARTASSARSAPSALPVPPTELVGRDEEVRSVRALLDTARLVTLTGPGGVGKTRLALAVAEKAREAFPDGVVLVELAAVQRRDPADVAEALAAALGLCDDSATTVPLRPPGESGTVRRLTDALRARRALLVLDNCEHVAEPVGLLVTDLLRAAPGLRILATSQAALSVNGETLRPVPPLAVPEAGTPAADLADAAAVRLFAARAAAASPGFAVDERNADAVATVCRRLDGVPLALELAATRVRALGVHELAARLDDRFALLTSGYRGAPDRQRTLRAVLDWSWEPLSASERAVLRRLSVFADGCSLEAAREVCSDPDVPAEAVPDVLADLVDRSMVTVPAHEPRPRYRLLESVAAYGAERLREAGEEDSTRDRHLRHHADLAERADPHLRTPGQREWLQRLDTEGANLRAALDHAVRTGASSQALRLVNALAWYWTLRGRLGEGTRSLSAVLDLAERPGESAARYTAATWRDALAHGLGTAPGPRPGAPVWDDPADADAAAHAEWFLAHSLLGFGGGEGSEAAARRLLGTFRARGDRWGEAAVSATLARAAQGRSDLAAVRASAERSMDLFTEVGDGWGQVLAGQLLGDHAEVRGDHEAAARHHREALRTAEGLGLWTEAGERLTLLGRIALLQGDHDRSDALHGRARRLAVEQGHVVGQESAELGLALTARRRGDLDTAERYLRDWLDWHLRMRSHFGAALTYAELGFVAELRGDAGEAERLHTLGLETARTTGDPRAVALALEGLSGARALAGEHRRAAHLLGTATALRESVGAPLPEAERGDVDRVLGHVRAALGDAVADAEFEEGRRHGADRRRSVLSAS